MNHQMLQISTLEFDSSGRYLAVGYSNGSIAIMVKSSGGDDNYSDDTNNNIDVDDMFIMDNDNISSLSSPSGIVNNDIDMMLDRSEQQVDQLHIQQQLQHQLQLQSSTTTSTSTSLSTFDILFYYQAHESGKSYEHEEIFNLNSISINSDCQTFLSSDEFRVYLWDLNIGQQCYNIIDLKPSNIQMLTEIIRVTEFHPLQCNSLIYGTSNGTVKLCDMRISALCNGHSKIYESKQNNQSIFSQYLNSILDLKFNKDGRYFVTRNLESLIIWDINMESKPLATYNLYNQEYLLAKLYDIEIITGSYDNKSLVWNPFTSDSFSFEALPYPHPLHYSSALQQSMIFDDQLVDQHSHQMFSFSSSTTTSPSSIVNEYDDDNDSIGNSSSSNYFTNNPFTLQSPPPLILEQQLLQQQQQQQQQWLKQSNNNILPMPSNSSSSQPLPSPPLPPSALMNSGYLFEPIQIDIYNQFNHIPVRNWSNISNNHINSSPFVNSNNHNQQQQQRNHSSSSSMGVDKLTIKDHLNSMINCISHANGSTALSNKNQLFIYSTT
ncbi:hypothetical protein PPL_09189 [Heterostelium album PN500]|uniref:Serine/threonine-protein phosphatase 2A 55 kDa regulatory subunit B n=1 Tax=Heterostelium pallidum (strain ATCC 26659 / Pp 5 / PN500) TaxID=670386 RepID=D3BKV7_HETP5|nr:hypothetical protein PPL_09189 [Heterostelium album PN500]EFA78537.1 hypothetical protein PPL_09189 [Heterostelium album PN500]|eukprot:XP_020430661.1 hypothetical protein PPL_09189 [Heterostelium album PN500]